MLSIHTINHLKSGNVSKESRLLLNEAESLLQNYDSDSLVWLREKTITEINRLDASFSKPDKIEYRRAQRQLSVLDMIINHDEVGGVL